MHVCGAEVGRRGRRIEGLIGCGFSAEKDLLTTPGEMENISVLKEVSLAQGSLHTPPLGALS